MEAGGLQERQEAFIAETGLGFGVIFVLSEGASGNPAAVEDVVAYAERIGSPNFPILAGGDGTIVAATPMDQIAHPEICVLTPELEIVECFTGHSGTDEAFDVIRSHAGIE